MLDFMHPTFKSTGQVWIIDDAIIRIRLYILLTLIFKKEKKREFAGDQRVMFSAEVGSNPTLDTATDLWTLLFYL